MDNRDDIIFYQLDQVILDVDSDDNNYNYYRDISSFHAFGGDDRENRLRRPNRRIDERIENEVAQPVDHSLNVSTGSDNREHLIDQDGGQTILEVNDLLQSILDVNDILEPLLDVVIETILSNL